MAYQIHIEPSQFNDFFYVILNGVAVACAKDYESADVVAYQIERQEQARLMAANGNSLN